MIATFFILAFDALFYLILTLYFERVLPGKLIVWLKLNLKQFSFLKHILIPVYL